MIRVYEVGDLADSEDLLIMSADSLRLASFATSAQMLVTVMLWLRVDSGSPKVDHDYRNQTAPAIKAR